MRGVILCDLCHSIIDERNSKPNYVIKFKVKEKELYPTECGDQIIYRNLDVCAKCMNNIIKEGLNSEDRKEE